MAAVLLSNPGLPLAVLGNPRRRRSRRRNPKYTHGGYSQSGGPYFGGIKPMFAKSKRSLRRALTKRGIHVTSITEVGGSRRPRKHTMAHRRRRSYRARKSAIYRRYARLRGKVYSRKVKGRRYGIKILDFRKGNGRKRKIRAVRWSGRRGSVILRGLSYGSKKRRGTHIVGFTNPRRRRKSRRSSYRRNPGMLGDYVSDFTSAPGKVANLFKGKGMVKNLLFTAGGGAGAFMIGGVVSAKVIRPLLEKFAPTFAAQVADPSTIAARVVGGALPYTVAFALSKLLGKQLGADGKTAVLVGGALATVVELIKPGMVGTWLASAGLNGVELAGLGALHGPVAGLGYTQLAGYYSAPSYAGQAGIVQAPAYQGSNGLRGYVQDGAQRLSGLQGTYLADADTHALQNNWLLTEEDTADADQTNSDQST